ncbi:MAG: hypothetical protein KKC19_01190 [Nanoarchaeota archaeon]|nr:hypothetical protein [Nanoarchaeota archaeon]
MSYAVYTTSNFDRERFKLSGEEQKRIEKIFLQLKINPYVGEQLQYRHLREKRIKEKRVYYLVYDDLQSVLLVAVSGKKDQQVTINHIINNFGEYKIHLENLLRRN